MTNKYINQQNYEARQEAKGFARPRPSVPEDRVDELLRIAKAMRNAFLDPNLSDQHVEVTVEVPQDRVDEFLQYAAEFNSK